MVFMVVDFKLLIFVDLLTQHTYVQPYSPSQVFSFKKKISKIIIQMHESKPLTQIVLLQLYIFYRISIEPLEILFLVE